MLLRQLNFVFPSPRFKAQPGRTSEAQCSPPAELLYGSHTVAAGGREVEFSCNKPYILRGDHRSRCLPDGSWSSRPPQCVRGSWPAWRQTGSGSMLWWDSCCWYFHFIVALGLAASPLVALVSSTKVDQLFVGEGVIRRLITANCLFCLANVSFFLLLLRQPVENRKFPNWCGKPWWGQL